VVVVGCGLLRSGLCALSSHLRFPGRFLFRKRFCDCFKKSIFTAVLSQADEARLIFNRQE
jgi:hypothetical protein